MTAKSMDVSVINVLLFLRRHRRVSACLGHIIINVNSNLALRRVCQTTQVRSGNQDYRRATSRIPTICGCSAARRSFSSSNCYLTSRQVSGCKSMSLEDLRRQHHAATVTPAGAFLKSSVANLLGLSSLSTWRDDLAQFLRVAISNRLSLSSTTWTFMDIRARSCNRLRANVNTTLARNNRRVIS